MGNDTKVDSPELLTPEDIDSIFAAISQEVTEKYPTVIAEDGYLIVFWLEGGSVWHASNACSGIMKSDQIKVFNGSVNDAMAAGKPRGCKICAKDIDPESITIDPSDTVSALTSMFEDSSCVTIVCWLEGSAVWHLSQQCSRLARSDPDKLIFGTVDEALSAGKERACKNCSE